MYEEKSRERISRSDGIEIQQLHSNTQLTIAQSQYGYHGNNIPGSLKYNNCTVTPNELLHNHNMVTMETTLTGFFFIAATRRDIVISDR